MLRRNRDLSCFSQGWYRLTFLTTPLSQACSSHAAWDAYLCHGQLKQDKIILSLTHKGQVDHSLTKVSPSCPATHSPHPFPPCNTHLHAMWRFLLSLCWSCDNFYCVGYWVGVFFYMLLLAHFQYTRLKLTNFFSFFFFDFMLIFFGFVCEVYFSLCLTKQAISKQ